MFRSSHSLDQTNAGFAYFRGLSQAPRMHRERKSQMFAKFRIYFQISINLDYSTSNEAQQIEDTDMAL